MPLATKRKYVRKSKYPAKKFKSFTTRVRKVISSAAQTKHATNEVVFAGMAGGSIYTVCPTQNIAAGTDIRSRLGDAVKLHKLRINGFFQAPGVANANVKLRVSVFYSSSQKAAATITSGAFTPQELFLPATYVANPIYGQFDEKALQLLGDVTMDITSNYSLSSEIKSFAMDIYLKDIKMNYIDSGSAFGEKKNLYIIFHAFGSGIPAANVGTVAYSYDLQFKDI